MSEDVANPMTFDPPGSDLPEAWLVRIKPELAPGERLIWAGEAKPDRTLSGRWFATIYAFGFAVLSLVGFAGLFGHFGERFRPFETGLALMGIGGGSVSFLIAIGVIASLIDKRSERRLLKGSLYALTDARAITWSAAGGGVSVQSIPRGTVKSVHRVEYSDGSGSVYFDASSTGVSNLTAGFHEIPDARTVEALVRLHLIGDDRTPST